MAKSATWRNTPFAHEFYHSKAWAEVRKLVWDRAHGLCENCLEKGTITPARVVHHKVPLNEQNMKDPDISLNPERLVALCHDCHAEAHQELGIGALGNETKEEPRVGFDDDGNVVRLDG